MEQQDQFVDFKQMTHKQLANVVTHMTGTGMKADFTSSEAQRDWARYYATVKAGRVSPVVFRSGLRVEGEKKEKKEREERKGLTNWYESTRVSSMEKI